jgi:UDP-N-acetylmuramoyl-L-alanyl-D-glutamate--2,6-diaminopimelate ligase
MRRLRVHLSDLIPGEPGSSANIDISGITSDSRNVEPGYLFFAIAGNHADGRDYIASAIAAGATAIVTDERELSPSLIADINKNSAVINKNSGGMVPADGEKIPILHRTDPRRELALAAARFWPRQPGMIAAVTGTNGKTSCAEFLRQIWQRATWDAVSIGTLGLQGADPRDMQGSMMGLPPLTTPDAVSLHKALHPLCAAGITHLALEASSHGLEQRRLDGLKIHVAGFTNLTRDHLDHHPDMEAYFTAKSRLFTDLLMHGGSAVINIDDAYGAQLAKMLKARTSVDHVVLTVGQNEHADFVISAIKPMDFGLEIEVQHKDVELRIPVALAGAFQAMNAITAAVMAHASGLALHDSLGALPYVTGADGRMQLISGHPIGARVIIDYAHTPDALSAALTALRPEARGKLAVLFGAGGDRDEGKRAMMGEVASKLADIIYVTDDNPRTENPADIRAAIISGAPDAFEISDRADAIKRAIGDLKPEDVLLIAGKGHESFQLVGDETLPFSDAAVARSTISSMIDSARNGGVA